MNVPTGLAATPGDLGTTVAVNSSLAAMKNTYSAKNHKLLKLKSPFLKLESVCRQYRPVYAEFAVWHEINLEALAQLTKNKNSPFCIYYSDDLRNSSSANNDDDYDVDECGGVGGEETAKKSSKCQANEAMVFKPPTSSTLISSTNQTLKSAKSPSSVANNSKQTCVILKFYLFTNSL